MRGIYSKAGRCAFGTGKEPGPYSKMESGMSKTMKFTTAVAAITVGGALAAQAEPAQNLLPGGMPGVVAEAVAVTSDLPVTWQEARSRRFARDRGGRSNSNSNSN
jgi:hypothetical protein